MTKPDDRRFGPLSAITARSDLMFPGVSRSRFG